MDTATQQRIAGRRWAEEVTETAQAEGSDFLEGYRRQLKRVFAEDLVAPDRMSEAEAIAFEAEQITFGKYLGLTWGRIPASYIGWLADQGRRLLRYVRSDRYRQREDQ
jgi:hypothetical protein